MRRNNISRTVRSLKQSGFWCKQSYRSRKSQQQWGFRMGWIFRDSSPQERGLHRHCIGNSIGEKQKKTAIPAGKTVFFVWIMSKCERIHRYAICIFTIAFIGVSAEVCLPKISSHTPSSNSRLIVPFPVCRGFQCDGIDGAYS